MKFTSVVLAGIAVAAVSVQAAPVAVPVAIANIDIPLALAAREPVPALKKVWSVAQAVNPAAGVVGAVADTAAGN
ncbi:hypothetical protein HDU97_002729 [Phlyctochytrium planicorne]|nr:hypothetical protein HDU97_002729 [Phlyctochytrium planicorne]